jgi:2-methylisocitrate lyase-like PEP mutase family enzyme
MTRASDHFRRLHREECFVMPNPFDRGSARLLAHLGFPALATTSGGFAASLGRLDMTLDRDTVVEHVAWIAAATPLPVNADSERCFADTPEGVAETVAMLAEAGAAGCSIEDWDPEARRIDPVEVAAERVRAAADAAAERGIVLTARCENHLHAVDDLDDTIARLVAYRDAGAEVLYAPGLTHLADIARIVAEVATPINALLMPHGPTVGELAKAGVRRVSVGSSLAQIAYGATAAAATSLQRDGAIAASLPRLDRTIAAVAFSEVSPRDA